jgi:uncharacterized FAD-dependent dehydrogenase
MSYVSLLWLFYGLLGKNIGDRFVVAAVGPESAGIFAGITRGLLQASASGILAGEAILTSASGS